MRNSLIVCVLCFLLISRHETRGSKSGSVIVINNTGGSKGGNGHCPGEGHDGSGESGAATTIVKTGKKGNTIIIKGATSKKKEHQEHLPIAVPIPVPVHVPHHMNTVHKPSIPSHPKSGRYEWSNSHHKGFLRKVSFDFPVFTRNTAQHVANLFHSILPLPSPKIESDPHTVPNMMQLPSSPFAQTMSQTPAADQQSESSGQHPVIALPTHIPEPQQQQQQRIEFHLPVFEPANNNNNNNNPSISSPVGQELAAAPPAPNIQSIESMPPNHFVPLNDFLKSIKVRK